MHTKPPGVLFTGVRISSILGSSPGRRICRPRWPPSCSGWRARRLSAWPYWPARCFVRPLGLLSLGCDWFLLCLPGDKRSAEGSRAGDGGADRAGGGACGGDGEGGVRICGADALLPLYALPGFAAAVVGPLDDGLGHVAGAPAERYGRRQRHTSEHDQERGRRELDGYSELRERREDRVDDDRRLGRRA